MNARIRMHVTPMRNVSTQLVLTPAVVPLGMLERHENVKVISPLRLLYSRIKNDWYFTELDVSFVNC